MSCKYPACPSALTAALTASQSSRSSIAVARGANSRARKSRTSARNARSSSSKRKSRTASTGGRRSGAQQAPDLAVYQWQVQVPHGRQEIAGAANLLEIELRTHERFAALRGASERS